jgi:large subunit ribosomal protein L3
MQRSGLLARKVGMTRLVSDKGISVAVTVLDFENCQVLAVQPSRHEGVSVALLGIGKPKAKNVSKPMAGQFRKLDAEPKRKLLEFKVADSHVPQAGSLALATHFAEGQFIDVTGTSKGKGFAGVMKRHNFGGLRASHGVSVSHRSHGSTGQRQDPGKVFKNKKMAGHMGQDRVTTQNIRVAGIDAVRNLLLIAGSVPGANGDYVIVRDAVKKVQKDLPSEGFRLAVAAAQDSLAQDVPVAAAAETAGAADATPQE